MNEETNEKLSQLSEDHDTLIMKLRDLEEVRRVLHERNEETERELHDVKD